MMNSTLAMLHDELFGNYRSLTGEVIRSVTVVKETEEWILCKFFNDRCHRMWLINKSTEMWTACSSSEEEWVFNFYDRGENWYSSMVLLNPEEFIEEQLETYHMEMVFSDNKPYFNINVEGNA